MSMIKKKNKKYLDLILKVVAAIILILFAIQNRRLAVSLSECQQANKNTQDSIDMICSLPFVDCTHENTQTL